MTFAQRYKELITRITEQPVETDTDVDLLDELSYSIAMCIDKDRKLATYWDEDNQSGLYDVRYTIKLDTPHVRQANKVYESERDRDYVNDAILESLGFTDEDEVPEIKVVCYMMLPATDKIHADVTIDLFNPVPPCCDPRDPSSHDLH